LKQHKEVLLKTTKDYDLTKHKEIIEITQHLKQATIQHQNELMVQSSKMASLGQMSAGIAHEVNNPLAIISGSLQQISNRTSQYPDIQEKINKYVFRASEGVERISKIVIGLKSYARDASKDDKIETSLKKIIEDVTELCREKFNSSGVQLTVDQLPKLQVLCRPAQVEQVFINLLNNSIDAVQTLPESQRWTKVTFEQQDSRLLIKITDGGSGIPEEVAAKIMDPFFTTKEVGKGTGLGLSISLGIVHDHGGSLTLDKHSKNTCFVVEFPIHNYKGRQKASA